MQHRAPLICLASSLALFSCAQLLGLDEFTEQPREDSAGAAGANAGSGNEAGLGGVAGAQETGGAGGAGGAATGGAAGMATGGTGAVECTRTNLDPQGISVESTAVGLVYHIALTTSLGDPNIADQLDVELRQVNTGTTNLGSPDQQDYKTCDPCLRLRVDGAVDYLATKGSIAIYGVQEDEYESVLEGNLYAVTLVETTIDAGSGRSTQVPDGSCLFIPSFEPSYYASKYPEVSIQDIQQYNVPTSVGITVSNATVTGVGWDGFWIQQGGGPRSGLFVAGSALPSPFGVSVGDVVAVKGTAGGAWSTTLLAYGEDDGITSVQPGGTPIITDLSSPISSEEWESVLVRYTGPVTFSDMTWSDPLFGDYYSVSNGTSSAVLARILLHNPANDPALWPFGSGSTASGLVGIVHSKGSSVQELYPRGSADFENYTPAPL